MNPSNNQYFITDITIIDVENGTANPGKTVLVVGDRIETISDQGKTVVPEGSEVIDGKGLYLMPGLTDAHVHYLDAPIFGRLLIANGILLVRDMGMPNDFILPLRDQLNRGEVLGPEMVAAGAILDGDPPVIPLISIGIRTMEEGRLAVRKQADAGVDFIKAYSRLDRDTFLAILDEANNTGLKVVGHIPDSIPLEDAAFAGMRCSEHFFGFEKAVAKMLGMPVRYEFLGMGPDAAVLGRLGEVDRVELQHFYQRLQSSGMIICPTVVVFKVGTTYDRIQAGNYLHNEYISPMVLSFWQSLWSQQGNLGEAIWRNWAQMVFEMNAAGIPMLVGTDLMTPGILPGFAVHEEMAIWQEAGIPPVDILRSATSIPAQFVGRGARFGSIEVGKMASMVLVRGNPLADIGNAQQIEGVFLRGQYFNRSDLDGLLREAQELASQPMNQ